MLKRLCCECRLKKAHTVPTVKHVDGSVDYVCKFCWARLDYGVFMKENPDATDPR